MLGEGLRAGLSHLGLSVRPVCYLEREAYPAAVLASRIQELSLDAAPIWSDLLTFDAAAWHGAVDGIVAGFPCQDLSLAGRRAGLDGKRSGLFFNILDIADACGAWFLFLENVAGIASATASVVDEAEGALDERAAARVVGELADRGRHAEWLTLSASDVGASHGRERWFCWAWREVGHTGRNAGSTEHWEQPKGTGSGIGEPGPDGDCGQMDDAQRCELTGERIHARSRADRAGTSNIDGASTAVANTECPCDRAQEYAADHGRNTQAERPTNQHCGCSRACVSLAHSSLPGLQIAECNELCGTWWGGKGGATGELRRPLFAPGPADPAWQGILQQWPEHAPALEPDFRGVVDGMAFAMDESRPQRLKCVGNGVVALQAAAAAVVLIRRAGFMKNQAVALINKAQAATECVAETEFI